MYGEGVGDVADWLESLSEHPWLLWLAVALVLGTVELLSLDLVFLMLAGGALAGAGAAALGAGTFGQVLVALAAAALLAATVRPVLLRRLRMPPVGTTNSAALVGRPAVVLSEVSDHGGLVKLAGETWSARARDDLVLSPGQEVVVTAIDGATAVVAPAPSPPPVPGIRPAPRNAPEEEN